MSVQDLEVEIATLRDFLKHPGWDLLSSRMRKVADSALTGMRNYKTQDDLHKHTFTYLANLDMIEAPKLLLTHAEARLKMELDKSKKELPKPKNLW